jgi:toluene monooxygenase electron transfer component
MGKATFDPAEERDLTCMVGGSGIAGIMSILRQSRDINYFSEHKLTMVFGVRKPEDFFFLDELREIQESVPANINIHLAVSDSSDSNSVPAELAGLPIWRGFVHEVAERVMAKDLSGRLGLLGGPPAMLDGSLRLLLSAGVPVHDIRYDKFG